MPIGEDNKAVMEFTVNGDNIKYMDKAWHHSLSLPTPVHVKFNKWVRVDA